MRNEANVLSFPILPRLDGTEYWLTNPSSRRIRGRLGKGLFFRPFAGFPVIHYYFGGSAAIDVSPLEF